MYQTDAGGIRQTSSRAENNPTMVQLSFVTLDVFTTTRYQGNPLAIVRIPRGQDVSTEQMQAVAKEFNLSETLFLHENTFSEDALPEWRVRIFVTNAEIPFAGHPTIGAAVYALTTLHPRDKGKLICHAGTIRLDYAAQVATANVPHNFHRHTQHPISTEDFYTLHPSLRKLGVKPLSIDVASPVKGMNFICIELADLETLSQVDTNNPEPTASLDDEWNEGLVGTFLYVVTGLRSHPGDAIKCRTRMLMGSLEDPATGSASCGLAALLALKDKITHVTKFELTQGVEMGRKSEIGVTITLNEEMDAVQKMELSGSAVKVMEGVIEV